MKKAIQCVLSVAVIVLLMGLAARAVADRWERPEPTPAPLTVDVDFSYYRVKNVSANDVLWIRRGRGGDYEKIGAIPFDGRCVMIDDGQSGSWPQLFYRGISGFAFRSYLEPDSFEFCNQYDDRDRCGTDQANLKVVGVPGDDVLWIRNKPDKSGDKLGAIPFNGRCVIYLDKLGNWYRVKYRGVTGFASVNYLAWER